MWHFFKIFLNYFSVLFFKLTCKFGSVWVLKVKSSSLNFKLSFFPYSSDEYTDWLTYSTRNDRHIVDSRLTWNLINTNPSWWLLYQCIGVKFGILNVRLHVYWKDILMIEVLIRNNFLVKKIIQLPTCMGVKCEKEQDVDGLFSYPYDDCKRCHD